MNNNLSIPEIEPERQYYFIEQVKEIITQKAEEKGSPLTYHIQTFGREPVSSSACVLRPDR